MIRRRGYRPTPLLDPDGEPTLRAELAAAERMGRTDYEADWQPPPPPPDPTLVGDLVALQAGRDGGRGE